MNYNDYKQKLDNLISDAYKIYKTKQGSNRIT